MPRCSAPWLALAVALALLPQRSLAGEPFPVSAEQITVGNAAAHLFRGTDADGGIDDWYLSNGIVEAIIDDVAPQDDLPLGVTPPPKQSEAGFSGGTLIDLGRVGANDDQLAQMFTVGGLSTSNFIVYDAIEGSVVGPTATIKVTGRLLGFEPVLPEQLPVVTEYSATVGDPFITIRTTVDNLGADTAATLGGFLDVFIWTDRALLPFSPLPARGFDHPVLNLASPLDAVERPPFSAAPGSNGPADGMIDPNTGGDCGEVSYGLLGVQATLDPDGDGPLDPTTVRSVDTLFGITDHQITALGNGPLSLGGLEPGGRITYTRRLYVAAKNDVAATANLMLPELGARKGFETGTLSGNVDAADTPDVVATVLVKRTGGTPAPGFDDSAPMTQARTDANGGFSGVVVPAGTYDLEVRSPERPPATVTGVVVAAGADTVATVPPLDALGSVQIELLEKVKGAKPVAIPGKIVFKGRKGDPDPEFAKDVSATDLEKGNDQVVPTEAIGGSLAQGSTLYTTTGMVTQGVRPGSYDVYASRGPEYSIQKKKITVKAGKTAKVKFVIQRVVETPDALSADFHIHSARSLDSSAGLEGRVTAYAGEGVEVMISTDHDFQLDYAPVISALDLNAYVNSIPGVEVTGSVPNPPAYPNSFGHINSWPMTIEPDARRDGSIEDEFVAPNWLFSRLRAKGAEVIQYNHPRAGTSGLTSIGFFNNIDYRPDLPLTDPANAPLLSDDVTGTSGVANPDGYSNLDFDVLEIGNGTSVSGWIETRLDWFSLLDQIGMPIPGGTVAFKPASGVADSHRITIESAGYFRSYVQGVGDDPTQLNRTAFDDRIKAGRMVGTTGPYIQVTTAGAGGDSPGTIGDTVVPAGPGPVSLAIRVQAAPWIPVDEVRVIANGKVVAHFDTTTKPKLKKNPSVTAKSKGSVVRFDETVPIDLGGTDAWVIVEAGAKLDPVPGPDPFASLLVPGYVAMSFTNPIFFDFAGDGFDAPGVSASTLAEAEAPLLSPTGRAAKAARAAQETRDHLSVHKLRLDPAGVARLLGEGS